MARYIDAGNHLLGITGSSTDSVAIAYIKDVVTLTDARKGVKPTLKEFIEYYLWRKPGCFCTRGRTCLTSLDRQKCNDVMMHLFKLDMSTQWTCMYIREVIIYEMLTGKKPSMEELHTYMKNMIRLRFTYGEFHNETKVKIGTTIDKYIVQDNNTDTCVLCIDTIETTQKKYKLPCNHTFHGTTTDCIDNNIQKWFDKNISCPVCRRDLRTMDSSLGTIYS